MREEINIKMSFFFLDKEDFINLIYQYVCTSIRLTLPCLTIFV